MSLCDITWNSGEPVHWHSGEAMLWQDCVLLNRGGGSKKVKKKKVIRFSDFASREEFQETLKDAVTETVILSPAKPSFIDDTYITTQALEAAESVVKEVSDQAEMLEAIEIVKMLERLH